MSIDSIVPPNINKLLKKIEEENGAVLNFDHLTEKNQSDRKGSEYTEANQLLLGEDQVSKIEKDFDIQSQLQGNVDQIFFEPVLNKNTNKEDHSRRDRATPTKRIKKKKRSLINKFTKKTKQNKKQINKNKNQALSTPKKVTFRRRSDDEYSAVVKNLTHCLTYLQDNKNIYKLISKNPFNQIKKEAQESSDMMDSNSIAEDMLSKIGDAKHKTNPQMTLGILQCFYFFAPLLKDMLLDADSIDLGKLSEEGKKQKLRELMKLSKAVHIRSQSLMESIKTQK